MELKIVTEESHKQCHDQPALPDIDRYFVNSLTIVSLFFLLAMILAVAMSSVELYLRLKDSYGEACGTVGFLIFLWICFIAASKLFAEFWDWFHRPSNVRLYILLGSYRRLAKIFRRQPNEQQVKQIEIQRAAKELRHQERVKKLRAWAERPLMK